MKKLLSIMLILAMLVSLAGCSQVEVKATEPAQQTVAQTTAAPEVIETKHAEVGVYVTFKGEKFISFNETTPFKAPNDKTYRRGDLLPAWEYMQEALNITVNDKTPKSGSDEKLLLEQAAATKFQDANLFIGSPRSLSDFGIQGYFVPLNEHLDKMPNFKSFLDRNPAVSASLTQADGNIYLTPYFDDIDQLERMFILRVDWVKALLDGDSPAFDTSKKVSTAYEPFYDYSNGKSVQVGEGNLKNIAVAKNVIAIQNELATKDGANLAQALRDYIDATYMNAQTGYTNRSDLFVSSNAIYDADELIALMRVVKANPVLLTGENKELTVFFPRNVRDAERVRMLGAIWGIRGVDSKNSLNFLNASNELVNAMIEPEYLEMLSNLSKLYKEGLILADFEQAKGQVSDFRALSFQTNDGFITYDYAASTVSLHDTIPAEDLQKFGTVMEPVVPAVAKWFGDEFEHYAESNRSVKTEGGWALAAHTKGDELDAALRLMDFPFSEDGLNVMSFGPKGLYWNELTDIAGNSVPKLDEQFYADVLTFASGNWSNFMRGFVGSTFGVGHVKQTIAIETQVSNAHYKNGIDRIEASPTKLASLSGGVAPERRIVPTILPLSEDQIEALSVNTFETYYREWQTRIIKYGFGVAIPNSAETVPTKDQFLKELLEKGAEHQMRILNQAYQTIK